MSSPHTHEGRATRRAMLFLLPAILLGVIVPRFTSGTVEGAALLLGGVLFVAATVAYAGVVKGAKRDYDDGQSSR